MRYETTRRPEREVWLTRHVLPDYQGSTVWTSLGAMYLQVLRTVDPLLAVTETARYVAWIERDGTFWEVMNAHGENWVSPRWIMIGEESMLWSAIFLDALENLAPAARLPLESRPDRDGRRGLTAPSRAPTPLTRRSGTAMVRPRANAGGYRTTPSR